MELLGDPFQSEFPELIEDALSLPGRSTAATVTAFNRKGDLLAVGSSDGKCYIWDFATRGIARTLAEGGHLPNCAVTAASWSRNGRRLLTASTDWQLMLWGVEKAVVEASVVFESPILHAQLHPRNDDLCIAVTVNDPPYLVDLKTKEKKSVFKDERADAEKKMPSAKAAKKGGMQNQALYSCSFDQRGERIYVGNNKGVITILDTATLNVIETISVQGGNAILSISFSPKGDFFLLNTSDRVIRVYETKTGSFVHGFQDIVNRSQWRKCVFSLDGEHVIGAQVSSHDIYIWSRSGGQLMKMLEGPKEGIMDLVWHPSRPIIASCSTHGTVYVWATNYMYFQNWSAFAPDFTELEENEEYIEREDEFDAADEEDAKQAKKRRADDQNAIVDIITVDKQEGSDNEGELFFLPTKPIPDRELDGNAAGVPAAPSGVQDISAGITIVEDPNER